MQCVNIFLLLFDSIKVQPSIPTLTKAAPPIAHCDENIFVVILITKINSLHTRGVELLGVTKFQFLKQLKGVA